MQFSRCAGKEEGRVGGKGEGSRESSQKLVAPLPSEKEALALLFRGKGGKCRNPTWLGVS